MLNFIIISKLLFSMKKSLIFPVNNKGGVGKTSLLVDLMTVLSINYNIGIIDTDHQATMFGTITNKDSFGNQNKDFYEDLETRIVELHPGADFGFAKGSKRMKIKIQPAFAPTAVFPVGMIYENPKTKTKLQNIVTQDMKNVDIIGVDLPPIPHPGLILDHSIMPIIEAMKDVELFPLVIVTPEKNTIEIGLRQYAAIKKYLLSKGIQKDQIHPICVVNKVPIKNCEASKKKHFAGFEDNEDKLQQLGILYSSRYSHPERDLSYVEFNKKFDFEGSRMRISWMPFIERLRHDGYCLLKGKQPKLFNFPDLQRAVTDTGFNYAHNENNVLENLYSEAMTILSNFISHNSTKRKKNYLISKVSKQVEKVHTKFVADIRTGLSNIYETWQNDEEPNFYKSQSFHINYRFERYLVLHLKRNNYDSDKIIQAVAKTEIELGLNRGWMDEKWRPGNVKRIKKELTEFQYENDLLKITLSHNDKTYISEIELKLETWNTTPEQRQRNIEYFDVFLTNLDKELYIS